MENVSAMAVDTVTMETPAPKHKWLAKGSRLAKKAVLAATTFGVMGATCATQAFAASGEVDTSSFITTACTVLNALSVLVSVYGVL